MSMLLGSDFIDADNSFNTLLKRNGADVFVKCYATSGAVANTPMAVTYAGSSYNATVLVASIYAYVGVPEGSTSIASGGTGWVQIRGPVEGVQAGSTDSIGSIGHIVQWHTDCLCASSSTYLGDPTLGDVGMLTAEVSSVATLDLYLTGLWATPVAAG